MTDVIKTSPVAPPSIALAMMATELASQRLGGGFIKAMNFGTGDSPAKRRDVLRTPKMYRISREYYRIIDCISAGEQP